MPSFILIYAVLVSLCLKRQSYPEDISQVLDNFCCGRTGEAVARGAVCLAEKQLVGGAMAFLQKHCGAGEWLALFKGGKEGDLRKLRMLVQVELQAHIEEKVQEQLDTPSCAHNSGRGGGGGRAWEGHSPGALHLVHLFLPSPPGILG